VTTELTTAEAQVLIQHGAVLLDVREDHEWEQGHAPDAVHMAMSRLNDEVERLSQDRLVVCICHVGQRSAAVADALNRAGWRAANLAGGMQAWEAQGLPVTRG
jgi:rhodanese-related sulfurtransferase